MDWMIGNEWKMEHKGIRKIIEKLDFTVLEKPTQVSKVIIKVMEIQNLKERVSQFLKENLLNKSQEMEMGTALTPIDYYLEILIQQMILGEQSRCFVTTIGGEAITFVVKLEHILESKWIHTLTVCEMYERAKQLKENGVAIFKDYPKISHDYFVRAAKCLISYKPFTNLTAKEDGVDGEDMEKLLFHIQTNLAANLLAEKRYEDAIYQTNFVDTTNEPSEKSIYRRAMAFYCIKEFEKAQQTIERLPNHREKKEFVKLQQRITDSWRTSNDQYKNVVQRMFS